MINAPISDQINSNEEIERLVNDNIRLVYWFSERYGILKGMTREEYESEMLISLWKSARTFNSSVSKFSTYAIGGMYLHRKQIKYSIKRRSKLGAFTIIDNVNYVDDDKLNSMFNLSDSRSVISRLMKPLTEYQKNLVVMLCDGMTNVQIAKMLGKCPSTTSEGCRSAVRKMRKHAERIGAECPL